MIRTEKEYKEALSKLREEKKRLAAYEKQLKKEGLKKEQIQRLMDPLLTLHLQFQEEVKSYEHLKKGDFREIRNFRDLGRLLVGLRIFKGLTQRQLAEKLGVHESQVSRDERNEYHGITIERVIKILETLGVNLRTEIENISPRQMAVNQ